MSAHNSLKPLLVAAIVCGVSFSVRAAHAGIFHVFADNGARLGDSDNDESGNFVNQHVLGAAVGEPGSNNENNEGRMGFYFDLAPLERSQLVSASAVTFTVTQQRTSGNKTGYEVDLYGITNTDWTTAKITDYEASADKLLDGAFGASDSGVITRTFDITDFARQQAALSATSTITLRLQVDPTDLPIGDGNSLFWVFQGDGAPLGQQPFLTVTVPEPSTLALLLGLGLVGLAAHLRPRRR